MILEQDLEFKNYKPTGGKLLRIYFQIEGNCIKEFKLRGDFFMHPESKFEALETFIKNTDLDSKFIDSVNEYITTQNITIFGFTVDNIFEILTTGKCS
jgi:hypothetical protein